MCEALFIAQFCVGAICVVTLDSYFVVTERCHKLLVSRLRAVAEKKAKKTKSALQTKLAHVGWGQTE